ncbi:unnamed protein product [Chilo suppressalis]|uniref:Ig-like domain-containing protein n=1 Tax=Chilo suppressalis TaxID=168631 RepID=A0ABN8B5D3_CHISP|nr:unnamed protein product [Chilo suppressalis]
MHRLYITPQIRAFQASPNLISSDFKTGDKKVVNGPFWHEVFTETYEDHDEDISTTTSEPLPFFEDDASTNNVTAQLGSRVHLHCRVHDLGEKTISWVRRRGEELHLLSFGRHTYSADSRYSLAFEHPNDWRLLIQCHISIDLPKVEIIDERGRPLQDKFYKEGSIIELRCVVSEVPQPTRQVNWKHGARLLNYDTKRGGVREQSAQIFIFRHKEGSVIELRCVVSEVPKPTRQVNWKHGVRLLSYDMKRGGMSVKTEATSNGALSRLYIANANRNDSGNYTCSLADVTASAVSVHVLRGENPLAMQRGNSGSATYPSLVFFVSLIS